MSFHGPSAGRYSKILWAPKRPGRSKYFSGSGMKVATGTGLLSCRASMIHMNCASQYFSLERASSVTMRYGRPPSGQQVWVEPGNGGDHLMWPMSFMACRSLQSMMEMPPPHQAQYMRLPRIVGGPCKVVAC